jgi:putative DNA primase/helicase
MMAADIHARVDWPEILQRLNVDAQYLRANVGKKEFHGPCPKCGGTDRYFFSNRKGRGDYYCRNCGGGDGFKLLGLVYGWNFLMAREKVLEAAGLQRGGKTLTPNRGEVMEGRSTAGAPPIAQPPARVLRLRRETCALQDCDCAVDYLAGRSLWPAAAESTLRAHVGVDYFDGGQKGGRYPALIADIRDGAGELVSSHVTYLDNGRKLTSGTPRKIFSPLQGRESCAVRLYPIPGDSMGIGEGLETCIAAAALHAVPVWSALNTTLLAKFTPPAGVKRLTVFADRDVPGLTAATSLLERLQGQVRVEIRTPPEPAKDWADVLCR